MEQIQEDLNISGKQENEQLLTEASGDLPKKLSEEPQDGNLPAADTEEMTGNDIDMAKIDEGEQNIENPLEETDASAPVDSENKIVKNSEGEEVAVPMVEPEVQPEQNGTPSQAELTLFENQSDSESSTKAPEKKGNKPEENVTSDSQVEPLEGSSAEPTPELAEEKAPEPALETTTDDIQEKNDEQTDVVMGEVAMAEDDVEKSVAGLEQVSDPDNIGSISDPEQNLLNVLPVDIQPNSATLPEEKSTEALDETSLLVKDVAIPDPQPSTSAVTPDEISGYIPIQMEDEDAAPDEPVPETDLDHRVDDPIPMEMDDISQAPIVLKSTSLPTLMPITEPEPVYSRLEMKKQETSSPLHSITMKGVTHKILKDIVPQSEGQQILQIPHQAPTIFIQGTPPVLTPIKQLDHAISQIQKKDSSETDDLATLANAALGDQAGIKLDEPAKKEPVWCDVGIIRGTSCHVTSYYDPSFSHDPEHENVTADNLPDYSSTFKIDLEPGTAYKFRVCAVNSCGRGPWSEVSAFKTCLPGYPGAPSSIKISKSTEGAHLSWEPPSNPAGNIIEYSVCLAVRNPPPGHPDLKGQQLAFVRVYSGPHNQTVVPNSSLAAAHIDTTSKPAIIFRIAAKNEKGFGPATQVRWLQDVVASPTGGVKPMIKKEPIASGIPMKRNKLDDF